MQILLSQKRGVISKGLCSFEHLSVLCNPFVWIVGIGLRPPCELAPDCPIFTPYGPFDFGS
jgi:hypothetical protein